MYLPWIRHLVGTREGYQVSAGWITSTSTGDLDLCALRVELRCVGLMKRQKFVLNS